MDVGTNESRRKGTQWAPEDTLVGRFYGEDRRKDLLLGWTDVRTSPHGPPLGNRKSTDAWRSGNAGQYSTDVGRTVNGSIASKYMRIGRTAIMDWNCASRDT